MKVLFIIPTFSNLSETFIYREVNAVFERGNLDVSVVSLEKGKATISQDLAKKVSYIRISYEDIIPTLSYSMKNFKHLFKIFHSYYNTSDQSSLEILKIFIKSVFYAQKLSKFDFDISHIHFVSQFSSVFSLSSLILKKEFSISGHAKDIYLESCDLKFKAKNAKFISICNTRAFIKFIELTGGKGRKNIVLAFHGIDPKVFQFKKRKINFNKKINILTDARFTEKKGLEFLSQAVVMLNKDYNFDLELTIIGLASTETQTQYMEKIKYIFKEAGLYSKLHIPGGGNGVSKDDLPSIYNNSDVFIYPGVDASDGDLDGVPNCLLQASFSGLPIITTQSGSISDLFNEKNSYIVNQRDPLDIIDKFNELVLDKDLDKKVNLSLKKSIENFSLDKNIEYLEKLLKS
jgi:colanic acid/amylovoran biosynthesis glycosyltransferase